MSLFGMKDIQPKLKEDGIADREPAHFRSKSNYKTALAPKGSELRGVIGEIKMGEAIHVPAFANWSSHHLIEYLLTQTGPANVYLTSWSIKSTAAKMLIELQEKGAIRQLVCVFDPRIRTQCPDAYQLIDYNIESVRLYKCHAKVTVIENEDWAISIVSTANLTRNPRVERYVITLDRGVAEFDRDWIEELAKQGDPFTNGVERRTSK